MAGNSDPIYSKVGDIQSLSGAVVGPTANTAQDGTSSASSMYSIYQADATNGGWLSGVNFQSAGSPAATVARIYISTITGAITIGTTNTASNTFLFKEVTLPVTTLSQTAAAPNFYVPMNIMMPPGYRILVSFGTSTGSAGTGYVVTAVAGKY
jgi:hypothetical protein